jgi:hypothetical protein
MRNPWRFSWDFEAKRLWVGDVGQSTWEEVDTVKLGGNYGWNYREAEACYTPVKCLDTTLINPIYFYQHNPNIQSTIGGNSITGGYVYRGNSIWWLKGKYVFGDYVSANIWALTLLPDSGVHVDFLIKAPFNIPSFAVDADKELYVINFAFGVVNKFTSDSLFVTAPKEILGAIKLSPNPAKDLISLELSSPQSAKADVQITSLTGQQTYSLAKAALIEEGSSRMQFYVGHLPRGAYSFQIATDREIFSKKIILE